MPSLRRLAATVVFALAWVASAAAQDPNALMDTGHFKRARPLVEARFRKDPNDPVALFLMARIKSAFGDNDGGIVLAERAVALAPNNAEAHTVLAELYGNRANTAGFFERASIAHKIKDNLETACRLDPKAFQPEGGLVTFYLDAPGLLGGSDSKARDLADRWTKLDPVHGYLMQADIALHKKQLDQLEGIFLKAAAADPTNYEARVSLANYYASDRVQQWDKVESNARAAVKLDPTRIGAYVLLAFAYANLQRWADLDKLIEEATRAVPDDLSPIYAAARTLVTTGKDLPRAERYFRQYLTQEPEANAPAFYGAHWRLGQVLEKEGKKPEAIAEYQACLRLKPDFEPAKKDLKRLQ